MYAQIYIIHVCMTFNVLNNKWASKLYLRKLMVSFCFILPPFDHVKQPPFSH